ncbi:hypothetical protein I4F81_012885 [Pyropia yezoensis]|uniref:Uncharacterized protein n=1 Tax=Pyropia yezoensis TaxID=2788 RepID=A0ACC3CK39_PYRYE|nr:hypothetical protein I4F81_012885 [Neopyropia yezoensis]
MAPASPTPPGTSPSPRPPGLTGGDGSGSGSGSGSGGDSGDGGGGAGSGGGSGGGEVGAPVIAAASAVAAASAPEDASSLAPPLGGEGGRDDGGCGGGGGALACDGGGGGGGGGRSGGGGGGNGGGGGRGGIDDSGGGGGIGGASGGGGGGSGGSGGSGVVVGDGGGYQSLGAAGASSGHSSSAGGPDQRGGDHRHGASDGGRRSAGSRPRQLRDIVSYETVLVVASFLLDNPPHPGVDQKWVAALSSPMSSKLHDDFQCTLRDLDVGIKRRVMSEMFVKQGAATSTTSAPSLVVAVPYALARMTLADPNCVPDVNDPACVFFASPRRRRLDSGDNATGAPAELPLPPAPPIRPFLDVLFRDRHFSGHAMTKTFALAYRVRVALRALVICDRSIHRLLAAAAQVVADTEGSRPRSVTAVDDAKRAGGTEWGEEWAATIRDVPTLVRTLRQVLGPERVDVTRYERYAHNWYLEVLYFGLFGMTSRVGDGGPSTDAATDGAPLGGGSTSGGGRSGPATAAAAAPATVPAASMPASDWLDGLPLGPPQSRRPTPPRSRTSRRQRAKAAASAGRTAAVAASAAAAAAAAPTSAHTHGGGAGSTASAPVGADDDSDGGRGGAAALSEAPPDPPAGQGSVPEQKGMRRGGGAPPVDSRGSGGGGSSSGPPRGSGGSSSGPPRGSSGDAGTPTVGVRHRRTIPLCLPPPAPEGEEGATREGGTTAPRGAVPSPSRDARTGGPVHRVTGGPPVGTGTARPVQHDGRVHSPSAGASAMAPTGGLRSRRRARRLPSLPPPPPPLPPSLASFPPLTPASLPPTFRPSASVPSSAARPGPGGGRSTRAPTPSGSPRSRVGPPLPGRSTGAWTAVAPPPPTRDTAVRWSTGDPPAARQRAPAAPRPPVVPVGGPHAAAAAAAAGGRRPATPRAPAPVQAVGVRAVPAAAAVAAETPARTPAAPSALPAWGAVGGRPPAARIPSLGGPSRTVAPLAAASPAGARGLAVGDTMPATPSLPAGPVEDPALVGAPPALRHPPVIPSVEDPVLAGTPRASRLPPVGTPVKDPALTAAPPPAVSSTGALLLPPAEATSQWPLTAAADVVAPAQAARPPPFPTLFATETAALPLFTPSTAHAASSSWPTLTAVGDSPWAPLPTRAAVGVVAPPQASTPLPPLHAAAGAQPAALSPHMLPFTHTAAPVVPAAAAAARDSRLMGLFPSAPSAASVVALPASPSLAEARSPPPVAAAKEGPTAAVMASAAAAAAAAVAPAEAALPDALLMASAANTPAPPSRTHSATGAASSRPALGVRTGSPPLPPSPPPPPAPRPAVALPGGTPPLTLPPGTDMVGLVAAALSAPPPLFSAPLWPPLDTDRASVRDWRAAVDATAAAVTDAVESRHALAAATSPGIVPPTATAAAATAAAAVDGAMAAAAALRRAAKRVVGTYPLFSTGGRARPTLAAAVGTPGVLRSGAAPLTAVTQAAAAAAATAAATAAAAAPSPPVATTRGGGAPDLRASLSVLAVGVPGGLAPATLVTAAALVDRVAAADAAGGALSPPAAGRLEVVAAALLAARHSPGVPPLPVEALAAVPALGVADAAAGEELEAALVRRLGDRGVVVSAAQQEATAWLLLWHWVGVS